MRPATKVSDYFMASRKTEAEFMHTYDHPFLVLISDSGEVPEDDGDGEYDTKMDPYYEDFVDYLRSEIPRDMHKELKSFLLDAKGYGNWSNQAGVIDRIIDHIIEGIVEDGLLEEELVD